MRVGKLVPHARLPKKVSPGDPGVTLFSAETYNLEYSEVHAFRTGLVVEIPEGSFGMLMNRVTTNGVVVGGVVLTSQDTGEVRVPIQNNHRSALEIKSGMPLCQFVIFTDDSDEDVEEFEGTSLSAELKDKADKARAAFNKEAKATVKK